MHDRQIYPIFIKSQCSDDLNHLALFGEICGMPMFHKNVVCCTEHNDLRNQCENDYIFAQ